MAAKAEHALSLFRSIIWRVLPVVHSRGGCLVNVNVADRTLQLDGLGCVSSFVGYIESYHRALVTSMSSHGRGELCLSMSQGEEVAEEGPFQEESSGPG